MRHATFGAMLALVAGSTFLSLVAYSAPLGNAVTLTAVLGASPAGAVWILASMSAGLAATLLTVGVVADRLGHRRVFLLGALAFVAGNLVCAAANGDVVFVLGRFVAGLGAAGMIATGLGLAASVGGELHERARMATWWSAALGAGVALGPVVSGLFDLVDAWRLTYVLLALGGAACWAGMTWLRPATPLPTSSRPLDFLGFVLLTAFLAVAVTAIIAVRTSGAGAALTLGALALALFVALALSQVFGRRHLIDPELFTHGPFLASTVAGFGTGIGVIGVMSFACSYLVAVVGLSTLHAAVFLMAWSGTSAVAALVFARLRVSGRTQLVVGLVGVSLGMALASGIDSWYGLPGFFLTGLAFGMLNTGLARQAVASVPVHASATGTAANNTARYLGGSIGVSAASILAGVGGWSLAAWSGAIASLLCGILVFLLDRARA